MGYQGRLGLPGRSRLDITGEGIGLSRSRGLRRVGGRFVDAPDTGDGSRARFMLMRLDADVGASLRVGIGLSASTRNSLTVRGRGSSVGS